MKILALDLGDKWIGTAISDILGITCKPFKSVKLKDLNDFLIKTIKNENIEVMIIGKPTTLAGKKSEQTKKIIKMAEDLEKNIGSIFDNKIKWILWDERLSSKRVEQLKTKKIKTKEDKIRSHSIAAAFILQSYLDRLAF